MMRTADHDVSLFARYRQQWDERNMPLQYGHGERQNLRSCPVARPDRQLASRESESESNGTTTRRRIAVAVGFSLRNKFEPCTDIFNSAAAVASEKSNVAETPEMVWAARIAGLLAQTRATSIVYVRCCYVIIIIRI